jgi:hypothetical protein
MSESVKSAEESQEGPMQQCQQCINAVAGKEPCLVHGTETIAVPQDGSFVAENHVDENGIPAGGYVKGIGLDIQWQNGPLGRGADRKPQNGAFIEDVMQAVRQRVQHYQIVKRCDENDMIIAHLTAALKECENRTKRREEQQVEGTTEGN